MHLVRLFIDRIQLASTYVILDYIQFLSDLNLFVYENFLSSYTIHRSVADPIHFETDSDPFRE